MGPNTHAGGSHRKIDIDTELSGLKISDQLRANSSFMKILAALFYYGNQPMNAGQLVIAVRTLDLLPLRGETPKSTIQGIISSSRKIARDLKISDPFRIEKDGIGRQANYAISDEVLNGVKVPRKIEIPDKPIAHRPVDHAINASNSDHSGTHQSTKRPRKQAPTTTQIPKASQKKKLKIQKTKKKEVVDNEASDTGIDSGDDEIESVYQTIKENEIKEEKEEKTAEEDTISSYTLSHRPVTGDFNYIDHLDIVGYPIASNFAIAQQTGYSYSHLRFHEKIKMPKAHCEDRFRVTDICRDKKVIGRLFILADGHGGPKCSDYFIKKLPDAINKICSNYDPIQIGDRDIQKNLEDDIKTMIQNLDEAYLAMKRQQLSTRKNSDNAIANDGCALVLNILLQEWLINVNVGDSRTILLASSELPLTTLTSDEENDPCIYQQDYGMDIVFVSQDHKPYFKKFAHQILENGGEFVDPVQNSVIYIDTEEYSDNDSCFAKYDLLKNAKIRPKNYQNGTSQPIKHTNKGSDTEDMDIDSNVLSSIEKPDKNNLDQVNHNSLRTRTKNNKNNKSTLSSKTPPPPITKTITHMNQVPLLSTARSCGDLSFKKASGQNIISSEPDVTFVKISNQTYNSISDEPKNQINNKKRSILFMGSNGAFNCMYKDDFEDQNKAISKIINLLIEEGENDYKSIVKKEEGRSDKSILDSQNTDAISKPNELEKYVLDQDKKKTRKHKKNDEHSENSENTDDVKMFECKSPENKELSEISPMDIDPPRTDTSSTEVVESSTGSGIGEKNSPESRAYGKLSESETEIRKAKEHTLIASAKYFVNRESPNGFFVSTLQNYDDCTIILVEI